METDVGVRVDPVPAGSEAAIDDRDRRPGMREERVGKRHPRGPGADHEIVGFDLFVGHPTMILTSEDPARRTTRQRQAGTRGAEPSFLAQPGAFRPPDGQRISGEQRAEGDERVCCMRVSGGSITPPMPAKVRQIASPTSPSSTDVFSCGRSPLFQSAAVSNARYRMGPPSGLSLRAMGRGMQTNSVRISPADNWTFA